MKNRQQKLPAAYGSGRMLDTRSENQDIARLERILAIQRGKHDLALEEMDREWPGRVVRRKISAGGDSHHSQPQRAFLDQRSRRPTVFGQNLLVDHPFVVGQVIDQYIAFDCSVH